MPDWAGYALDLIERGQPCALVSVLAVEGSTPREAGTRMVVTKDKTFGSVGGGNLEFQAIQQARAALAQAAGTWRIQDYPLGPLLAQCCGGRVRLMIEHLSGDAAGWLAEARGLDAFTLETTLLADRIERRLGGKGEGVTTRGPMPAAGAAFVERIGRPLMPVLMCGAGHVGVAIARVLASLPFAVDWLDVRPEAAELAGVRVVSREDMIAACARTAGLVLILTHDHQLDYELCTAALGSEASFIGVIGSATKDARFRSRLTKDGASAADLERLHCPIGLPGLRGKAPDIIAVSVAAQLLYLAQDKVGAPLQ